MPDHAPIFRVIIDAKGATMDKVEPGRPGYGKARKSAILRQRDAIESFRKLKTAGKGFDGTHAFHFLDSARTFAMLYLQLREYEIGDSLDRVLAFDGRGKSGGK